MGNEQKIEAIIDDEFNKSVADQIEGGWVQTAFYDPNNDSVIFKLKNRYAQIDVAIPSCEIIQARLPVDLVVHRIRYCMRQKEWTARN